MYWPATKLYRDSSLDRARAGLRSRQEPRPVVLAFFIAPSETSTKRLVFGFTKWPGIRYADCRSPAQKSRSSGLPAKQNCRGSDARTACLIAACSAPLSFRGLDEHKTFFLLQQQPVVGRAVVRVHYRNMQSAFQKGCSPRVAGDAAAFAAAAASGCAKSQAEVADRSAANLMAHPATRQVTD